MGILWLMLKILFVIVVALLGGVIVATTLILTLPIDYVIKAERYDEIEMRSKIKVFYIVTILYELNKGKSVFDFKILGRQINKKHVPLEKMEETTKEITKDLVRVEEKVAKETTVPFPSQNESKQTKTKNVIKNEEKVRGGDKENKGKAVEKKATRKREKMSKTPPISKLDQLKLLWNSEYKKGFVKALKKMISQLIRAIRPHTFRFNLIIGRDNPANTGELLATVCMFYPLYAPFGNLQGNFEQEGIWGDVELGGRLRVYRLIKPFILFLISKSVRNYIKIILNIRKEEANGISIK